MGRGAALLENEEGHQKLKHAESNLQYPVPGEVIQFHLYLRIFLFFNFRLFSSTSSPPLLSQAQNSLGLKKSKWTISFF